MDILRSRLLKWAIPLTAAAAYFWYRWHKIDASELKQSDPGGDTEERENCISLCAVPLILSMQNLPLDKMQQEDIVAEEQRVSPEGQQVVQEEPAATEQQYMASEQYMAAGQQFIAQGQQYLVPAGQYVAQGQQYGVPIHYMGPGQQYGIPIQYMAQGQQYGMPIQYMPQGQQYGMQRYMVQGQQAIAQEQQYNTSELQYTSPEQCMSSEIASEQQCVKCTKNNIEQSNPIENTTAVECEPDSGNPSPRSGEVQAAGPLDESRSEGSLDSGKGSFKEKKEITYDFVIPQHLVGRLIGRQGNFLHSIRDKTNIAIYVHDHPMDCNLKLCSMQGNADSIAVALKMIRQKFPEKKFLEITLERVTMDINTMMSFLRYRVLSYTPLTLIPGINNEINLSHIVKPNWFFANNITHPTYSRLRPMEDKMMLYYGNKNILATNTAKVEDYVAVFWNNKWVRGSIKKINLRSQKYLIKLLDHGGFWVFESHEIRPLFIDFHQLPFQAIEISLANIKPKDGVWKKEAYDLVALISKTSGIAQAQIAGYVGERVYVHIYYAFEKYVFSLAEELIAREFAESATWADIQSAEEVDFVINRELLNEELIEEKPLPVVKTIVQTR